MDWTSVSTANAWNDDSNLNGHQEVEMLQSDKFAVAAHMHVVLRRKCGRVTDVEWMMKSPDYAREVIRVARAENEPDLQAMADKLEAALFPVAIKPMRPMPEVRPVQSAPDTQPGSLLGAAMDAVGGGVVATSVLCVEAVTRSARSRRPLVEPLIASWAAGFARCGAHRGDRSIGCRQSSVHLDRFRFGSGAPRPA